MLEKAWNRCQGCLVEYGWIGCQGCLVEFRYGTTTTPNPP